MTIIEQLKQLKQERDQARQKVQEIETDLLTTIKAIQEATQLLGISEQFTNINKDGNPNIQIGTVFMKMLPKVTKLLTQDGTKERIKELITEVMPMLQKYKYLYNETQTPIKTTLASSLKLNQ